MKRFIILLVLLLLTALQNSLVVHIKIFGVIPDIILVFIICFTLVRGNPWATIIGAAGGIMEDVFFQITFGINSIACMVTAYIVGMFEGKIYKDNILVPAVFTFGGTLVKELLVYMFLYLTRNNLDLTAAMTRQIIPEAIYNTILAVLFFRYVVKLTDKFFDKQSWWS